MMAISTADAAAGHLDIADMQRRIRAIVVGSAGNLVEWYDFYAYAAFSLYFASAFFPNSDPVVEQLNAALVFAAGFLVRPLGGWLFGYLADRHGRRGALMLSVSLMCFGSLMIAIMPTYAQVGLLAPFLLAAARILQGLSLGGEYGTSATYLTEVADERHRGFFSSFQYVTLIGGQIAALIVLLLLQKVFLTGDEIRAWGWRIPFFIGAALAGIALVMRRTLHETEAFEEAQSIAKSAAAKSTTAKSTVKGTSSLAILAQYPREVLLVVGLTAGGTAAFYTYTTYMQKFLKLSVGLTDDQTTLVTISSLVFGIVLQPIYGAISDRIGRKWLLIGFGVTGVLFTVPLLAALEQAKSAFMAFVLISAAWAIVSGYTSINAVVKAELFPTRIRALGVGLPYAVTVSIFGGTTDSIALWFKSIGHETWFSYYLTAMIGISLFVYVFMRDTKADSAMNRHA
jgi:MHS family alpha-ketoglutarate permease-like MFS transporter